MEIKKILWPTDFSSRAETALAHVQSLTQQYQAEIHVLYKHIAIGDPAQEILKLIREKGIDMVVMATRGRKSHFQFGSVVEKVVKNATVPVVTIPTT